MSRNLLETKTLKYKEIIGNGKTYRVPEYQRNYSWNAGNWEELWLDIKGAGEEGGVHYLGAIVLKNEGKDNYTIIDGQQRIATLSILVIAAVKILTELIAKGVDGEKNEERKSILMRTFLGDKDPTSLNYTSKLYLNEIDDDFYQTHLLQLRLPLNKNKLGDSNKLMLSAYEYFYNRISAEPAIANDGEKISEFLMDVVASSLLFIQITVEDELSAYTIFETLNARGLELTSSDLLKNYLFSLVRSRTDRNALKAVWNSISSVVTVKDLPQFLRHFINSRRKLVRKENLFKEIKNTVKSDDQVFGLLEDLKNSADIYMALSDYEDELWKDNAEQKKLIKEIALIDAECQKPLLLSAYLSLNKNEFTRILRIVRAVGFRYHLICELNMNELESAYNRAAVKIFNGEIARAPEVLKELAGVYPPDEDFKNSFATKSFNAKNTVQKKLVRYILLSIENQKYGRSYDATSSNDTIEHILPENLTAAWAAGFSAEKHEKSVCRLGNMCVLENKLNSREAADKNFIEKIEVYKKSQCGHTVELADCDEWTEEKIRDRQRKMADCAASIWKANY
jgi:uncharacterized protein with ParB-like and HNH nuclease domain